MTLEQFATKACTIGANRGWISVQAQQAQGTETPLGEPQYQIWDAMSSQHFYGVSPDEALENFAKYLVRGNEEPKTIELTEEVAA